MSQERFYIASQLKISDEFVDLILSGKKKSTIRKDYVLFDNVRIPLISNQRKFIIKILKLDFSKRFSELDELDAINDGFKNENELKETLRKFYPSIDNSNPMTIVYFQIEGFEHVN